MTTINHITGYILAGGKSSRMGTEKGLLPLEGDSLTGHILKNLKTVFSDVRIISGNTEYNCFGVPVIPDEISDCGPAGGILTGLRHSHTSLNFFIGCDMPFVTREIILQLVSESVENTITVPVLNGYIEPLCGIYPSSIMQEWEKLVCDGRLKMQELISCFTVHAVEMNQPTEENSFYNINTPEDYNGSKEKYFNR